MRVEAVVLDMDGLMLDTEPLYKAAWQRASSDLGYNLDDRSYARLVGRPTLDCERELLDQFGAGFPLEAFRSRWPELWRAGAKDVGIARRQGLTQFLDFVEQRGLPTAVATSSEAEYTEFSLRQAGLDGRFRVVVTGDQIARGKPAPDIYIEAARRLDVEPARCVALEDSEAGIIAASSAGMVSILIPEHPPSAVAARAAFQVLRSLDEARLLVARLIGDAAPDSIGGSRQQVTIRTASLADVASIEMLIAASARALAAGDYSAEQIEAALLGAWGVDTELIRDGTYFVGEAESALVLCGGWSRRATTFGGDAYDRRESRLLDPRTDAARIRAFFVHPRWARRGLASRLLALCEREAGAAGFLAAELVATLPGERLYARHGYVSSGRRSFALPSGGRIDFVPMRRRLN
jgi:beta-phosphoglucomutase-like phosphatase (HAD superfamily)/GNAT superfamily N-acetyltransferase